VYINTGSLKDRDFANLRLTELDDLLRGANTTAEAVYQLVKSKLNC
jgi:hypothetical protein